MEATLEDAAPLFVHSQLHRNSYLCTVNSKSWSPSSQPFPHWPAPHTPNRCHRHQLGLLINAPPSTATPDTTGTWRARSQKPYRGTCKWTPVGKLDNASEEIGACLEPAMGSPDLRGSCTVLKSWYHHTSARAHIPLRADMAKDTGYYAIMYK